MTKKRERLVRPSALSVVLWEALARCRLLRMLSIGAAVFGFGLLSEIIERGACYLLKTVPSTHRPKILLRALSGNY